jgi:translation initiation factor IF-2
MGHVDHGKTSLLDYIRKTNVIAGEAGGITQHIGAYEVQVSDKKSITFLDTPGHEAFTAMRARGAQVTDIAVLVVAADDGVMPQTIEAINHAKAANVPIIVAINKMDKTGANPDRVKQELTEYELVTEEWGGSTIMVPVSALKNEGIDDLLENILLVAEMQELVANPNTSAKGTIIEAQLDTGRGPVATVLIQNGTLKVGDSIVAGTITGRVRAMIDDKGNRVTEAGPSTPVEVLGFSSVPLASDIMYVADERLSRKVAADRKSQIREEQVKSSQMVTLDDLFNKINEGKLQDLNIVLKADVQGSVEAMKQSLVKLSNDEVRVNIKHSGVGAISESDVILASASSAIIIGFNVRPDNMGRNAAEKENVEIRTYRVIYNALEDVEKAIKGMLKPEYEEHVLGHAEVRNVIRISNVGNIAGSYITDGIFTRNSSARVLRDSVIIYEGELASLRRFKDDVKEVKQGYECGIGIENFNDIKEGDIIEAYVMKEIDK